jgi:hypothetical protein
MAAGLASHVYDVGEIFFSEYLLVIHCHWLIVFTDQIRDAHKCLPCLRILNPNDDRQALYLS